MEILRAYFSFYGRLNRADYALVFFTGYLIPGGFVLYLEYFFSRTDEMVTVELFMIGLLMWVVFAALAKRLHDIGKPGLACLAIFIPIVGPFTPFVLLFLSGNEGKNLYGPPQKYFFL